MSNSFQSRLIEAMELNNIKAADLAKKTGLSKAQISQYTNGVYKAKQVALYKLAVALNVSEAWLMGHDVPMERSVANVHDNSEVYNNGVIGTNNGELNIHQPSNQYLELNAQEADLLRIFRAANGKQQLRIMNIAYEVEDEIKKEDK